MSLPDKDISQAVQQETQQAIHKAMSEQVDESLNRVEPSVKQAALDITAHISENLEQPKPKRKTIRELMGHWLTDQVNRLSQAVMALIIAGIVALVTPFLVKHQLHDDFTELSARFNNKLAVTDQKQRTLIEKTQTISDANRELEQTNAELLAAINDIKNNVGTSEKNQTANNSEILDQQRTLTQQLNQLSANNQRALDALKLKIDALNKITTQAPKKPSFKPVIRQLNTYINTGRSFTPEQIDSEQAKNWISEVYFFVSFMPETTGELSAIKSHLAALEQGEKSRGDLFERSSKTLLILTSLKNWLQALEETRA